MTGTTTPDTSTSPPPETPPETPPGKTPSPLPWRWLLPTLVAVGALGLAWSSLQRVKEVEATLVKRQDDAGGQAAEARALAKAADELARESAARLTLLDNRMSESILQRTQLESLLQSLDRSRDENILADLDAALRLAAQQTALTGSAEALVLALQQADERLARHKQPRLERVRRAVLQDLDRVRTLATTDIPALTLKLDELVRQVDEWPLLAVLDRKGVELAERTDKSADKPADKPAKDIKPLAKSATPEGAPGEGEAPAPSWWQRVVQLPWASMVRQTWADVQSLVRVTRVDRPDAALLAPEQAFFVRENLKLRLLNARLALFSRQFDAAQSDLRLAQSAMELYFDRSSRRVIVALEQLRAAQKQSSQVAPPRPDATLAALAAVMAGR